jgi:Flp pilus assembly protein TadD
MFAGYVTIGAGDGNTIALSVGTQQPAPSAMETQMFSTIVTTRSAVVGMAAAVISFTVACSPEKGGKTGSSLSIIPAAEAANVPVPDPVIVASKTGDSVVGATATEPDSGEITYAAAEAAYNSRRYSEARGMFEDIVSRNPTNGWGYYMLALSTWKSGDRVGAESAFNSALVRDPRHVKSHLNLARVMMEDGRFREAIVHAEKVVQLDSMSTDGYRLLGQLHGQVKNLELALLAYDKAITLNPRDAWSMNNMAFLLLENGRVEEALGPLALAVTIEPRNAVLQNNLGTALELTGRFTQAAEAYRSAITFESGYEKASTGLARIAGRKDDPSVPVIDLKVLAESYAAKIGG